jgi:hypothetical protein
VGNALSNVLVVPSLPPDTLCRLLYKNKIVLYFLAKVRYSVGVTQKSYPLPIE